MNSLPDDGARPLLEIRGARASSVIVQQIPAAATQAFLEWQRGITAVASEFPGYQTTEIYPPLEQQKEWVVIVHFDDSATLQSWLTSTRRTEWLAKLPCEVRDYRLKTLPAGFGSWFAGFDPDAANLPHWKMALAVLFVLYPTAMLLTFFMWPYMEGFGLALSMLISNAISVSFLEWVGMPIFSRVFRPWLQANGKQGRAVSFLGLLAMAGGLGIMLMLFRLVRD